jgi:hypothetical protein
VNDQTVILFPTSAHVMRAEKLLKDAGYFCRLIPVPRHLSSDCGICLVVLRQDSACASALLNAKQVDYDTVISLN